MFCSIFFGMLVAMASLSIVSLLIEMFLRVTHSLHPVYHFLSAAVRTAIWLALLIATLAAATYIDGDHVFVNGSGFWLPSLLL